MPTTRTRILSPELVAQLSRFRLAAKRRVSGRYAGAHRSKRFGASLDFADYREYVRGDDPRRVDLAAYRRLGRLLIKLYEAEDEAAVRVVVDLSASMGFGDKLAAARQIAAAFAALAAGEQDRVRLFLVGGEREREDVRSKLASGDQAFAAAHGGIDAGPWLRGPSALFAAEDRLLRARPAEAIEEEGEGPGRAPLDAALRQAGGEGPVGPVVLVSDLLFDGWEETIRVLASNRGDAMFVHVLGREDLDPTVRGDVRLVDAETGLDVEVGVGDAGLDAYAEVRDTYLAEVEATCGRHGVVYARLVDDQAIGSLVLETLRGLGVVA